MIVIIVGIVLIKIYFRKNTLKTDQVEVVGNNEINEKMISKVENPIQSFWNMLSQNFFRFSEKEKNPIRMEFRQLLKELRKAEIWKNDMMTVEQINQLYDQLKTSSTIYQRVRYGDQNLSDIEIQEFKQQIKEVMTQIQTKKR